MHKAQALVMNYSALVELSILSMKPWVPADAPLWMTVNYPGGKGVVNLAVVTVKSSAMQIFLIGQDGNWLMMTKTLIVSAIQLQ
ncbi:Uncharacterised protein [Salmonella enterica subsp. salamae]|uniref:BACON domain-containing protein n=1 Tax=Salmonella enterica subsp. salamae TaxID=59202 RepID=A0A6D2GAP3_SALER|nr:Uncharacterised protein [Salmonella enterica subsp. salamae]